MKHQTTVLTSNRFNEAMRLLDLFLTGCRLTRGDIQVECGHQDANQLLHVLRNEMCIPISCQRGINGMPSVWFMTQEDIDSFNSNRDEQVQNQRVKIAESLEIKKDKLIQRWLDEEGEEKLLEKIKGLSE